MSMRLEVRDLSVAYDGKAAVTALSFGLEEGAIGCLLGPSGCGKTTALRAIAGFEPVAAGEILIGGRRVSAPGLRVPPERRRVGMVFQDFALFPHLTVEDNLGFGLGRLDRRARRHRIGELLELVGLSSWAARYPHQLSGGMQQRAALARALAPRPEILLLDEPFSSLDATLREQLARELGEVLRQDGATAVLVTHDQLEAFAMADAIGVLGQGALHQWGSGFELYHRPADRFVADFIGQGTLIPGIAVDARTVETELGRILGERPHGMPAGTPAEVLIRPDDLKDDPGSPCRAWITDIAFRGAEYLCTLRLGSGARVLCLVPSQRRCVLGEEIGLRLDAGYPVAFPRD